MTSFIETLNHWGDQFLNFAWPMLWQSSLLITIIFVLDFAFRRKIRAAIRHAFWLVVLLKLVLPPALALPTGAAWWLRTSPQANPKPPATPYVVTYGNATEPGFPIAPPPVLAIKPPAFSSAAGALMISSLVSIGLLGWMLFRWRQLARKIRRAANSNKLDASLNECRSLARLRQDLRIKLTGDSMSPAVCGLFRPVILLPQSLVEKLSAGQLRAVLLHEAIHLRRGDVWVNCAQALLQIVYWWHPLLWLANARIRRAREEAVDDAVMLALRDDAEVYAPTLLEVAKLAFNRPLASLGLVGILESRSALRQRIERLMDFRAPQKAGVTIVSILGILAFSAIALPMGEAPAKTGADAVSVQMSNNPTVATNVVDRKIESDKLVRDGKLLYEMGKFKDAEAKLKAALALNPDNQAAHYYLDLVAQSRRAPKPQGPRIVYPALEGSATNLHGIRTSPGREMIYRKLNSLHLESVSWSNSLPLSEVIRYLAEQSRLLDPDKTGINFVFDPNVAASAVATNAAPEIVDPSTISVKLVLNNVSLHDVLDAVVQVVDRPIRYTVENYAVVISPKPSTVPLEMRVFKIDTNTFTVGNLMSHISRGPIKLETNNVPSMAISFFRAIGVNLTAPGRSIAFNDRLGMLFVRATAEELENVRRVIEMLNNPQIHIKARFIEVPKKGFVMSQLHTNAATGQMTGILSDAEFRTVLYALERQKGAETLAEPECITSSGRQTQMRATDAQTIVTNLTLQRTPTNSSSAIPQTEKNKIGPVVPQIAEIETGPTLDVIPYVLSDGYTINLTMIAHVLEFLGYDRATNTVYATNSTGQTLSWQAPRPGFRTQQAMTVVNLWDNQTLVLGKLKNDFIVGDHQISHESKFIQAAEKKNGTTDKELLVFITATIVDPAGNRVHTDNELRQLQEKAKSNIPPQPESSTPSQ